MYNDDKLIDASTSKLAKEKGYFLYHKNALGFIHYQKVYDSDGDICTLTFDQNWRLDTKQLNLVKYDWRDPDHKYFIRVIPFENWYNHPIYIAPTQTRLAYWLRTEHDIHVWVNPIAIDDYKFTIITGKFLKWHGEQFGYKTHELAMEAGLEEALKQIELK